MTDREKLHALMDTFSGGSQQVLADLIGVPRSNIATWMHRGSITAAGREAILDTFPQVSRQWLAADEEPQGASMVPATITFSREDTIPYFSDCRASCGVLEQMNNTELSPERIHLPGIHAEAAITATGDSMLPTIHDGDLCLVGSPVTLQDVNRRHIYLIVTTDAHCMFKRIQDDGPQAEDILVLSENPDFHAQRIDKRDIIHIYPLTHVLHEF